MNARAIHIAAVVQAAAAFFACGGGAGRLPADGAVERPAPPGPYARPEYLRLSETGLFIDPGSHTVLPEALAFEPAHRLWSDGADKRRWIRLPPGTQVDTSDMDHWMFPIGTKLWKEFSRNGVLLETRLIERFGEGPDDYWMGTFVWNADRTDASFVVDGQKDIGGTMHDAPPQKDCDVCHRGDPGRVLGFSAIQLATTMQQDDSPSPTPSSGTLSTLSTLNSTGLLSHPPVEGGYPVPGDPLAARTLGYLHANCGHCHNKNGTSWHDTQMALRLRVGTGGEVDTSEVQASIVGRKLQYWRGGPITLRVAPGAPEASALLARMQTRGSEDQMPSISTELVDSVGIDLLRAWISSLPP